MSDYLQNKHFCILPWVHLHVSQNGRVSPCCNNNTYLGNVRESSIDNIWNGKKMNKIRNQFLNNQLDPRCNHCYQIEASGKESMRQISNRNYQHKLNLVEHNKPSPIYWDIRFSNVCNFRCKTCWHGNSSSWFGVGNDLADTPIIKAFTDSYDELLNYIDDVEEIYFAGGEPLIMEEHYELLNELLKRKLTNVRIRYNTNFSRLDFKSTHIFDLWKQFNEVHVSASIDAMGETGEEIREGLNWEQFVANRKKMMKGLPDVYFEIAPTISTLNIEHVGTLHQTMVNEGLINIDHIYLNLLERPVHFNVKSLSTKEKERIAEILKDHIQWLQKNNSNQNTISEFEKSIRFMNQI